MSTNDCSIRHVNAIIYSAGYCFGGFTICRRVYSIDTHADQYAHRAEEGKPGRLFFVCESLSERASRRHLLNRRIH